MDSKYNLDLIFKKPESENYLKNQIFRKAALVYHFDPDIDFKDYDDEDLSLLKKFAFEREDGKFRIKNDDRRTILKDNIGINNILPEIEKYKLSSKYTRILKDLAGDQKIELTKLNGEELYYVMVLSSLFENKIDPNKVKDLYNRKQLFSPFEKICNHFVGRKNELQKLNNYVDWLPKNTLIDEVKFIFRNIINWQEKPPLLIKGIGGIGKTTLVAKFILEQNNSVKGKTLPFIYFDFDLPGLSIREPLTILIEAMRQLGIQYPGQKKLTQEVSAEIAALIDFDVDSMKIEQSSSESSRSFVYDRIKDIIAKYNIQLKDLGSIPVLIVFDSFEEMQYRATADELYRFFLFIREISEQIPRIRPVFAGRAEVPESFINFKFNILPLVEFDKESSEAFLIDYNIKDVETRQLIYKYFGGNPLMLRLATEIASKNDFEPKNISLLANKKWEYLINRILGHIHEESVRNIAIPGMLVRYITPEIIKEVLAGPTNIGQLPLSKCLELFESLKKEVSIITKSIHENKIAFRQDLRMACEAMILEKYPIESEQIHLNAQKYYLNLAEKTSEPKKWQFLAEYFFHTLKMGDIPENLNARLYDHLRIYLDPASIELPHNAQLYLNSLSSQSLSPDLIKKASDSQQDFYYLQQIKKSLNGEWGLLKDIYSQVSKRPNNTVQNLSEYGLYSALLFQRMDKIKDSNFIILQTVENAKKIELHDKWLLVDFKILHIQNLEYEGHFKSGLKQCRQLLSSIGSLSDYQRMKLEFLNWRLSKRIFPDYEQFPESIEGHKHDEDLEFVDTQWNFIFKNFHSSNSMILTQNDAIDLFNKISKIIKNKTLLDKLTFEKTGKFLNSMSLNGALPILIKDYIFSLEILGLDPLPRADKIPGQ